jgi:hypothetical protein
VYPPPPEIPVVVPDTYPDVSVGPPNAWNVNVFAVAVTMSHVPLNELVPVI